MDRIRRFLWKYLGMTLDGETIFVVCAVTLSCIAMMVFGILAATTGQSVFRLLAFFFAIPALIIPFGGSYNAMFWGVSNKKERAEIEKEVALKQLKRRVRDKRYQR
jgi:hypothetical protein